MRIPTPAILLLTLLTTFSAQATPKPAAQPPAYNPNTHIQNTYATTSNNFTINLQGLANYPFISAVPDSTAPVYLLTGPNPLSHVEIILLVTEPADFSFEISGEQVEPFTLEFAGVAPGPYGGTIDCDGFIWERFQLRLLYKGAVVGEPMIFVP